MLIVYLVIFIYLAAVHNSVFAHLYSHWFSYKCIYSHKKVSAICVSYTQSMLPVIKILFLNMSTYAIFILWLLPVICIKGTVNNDNKNKFCDIFLNWTHVTIHNAADKKIYSCGFSQCVCMSDIFYIY